MKKTVLIFLGLALWLPSWAQQDTHETTQMQRLVKEHDDIMAKDMGEMGRLIGQLQDLSRTNGPHENYQKAIDELKTANKAMVDWMHGFGARFDGDEMYKGKALTDQKKVWLNEEEIKFFEMKEQLKSSIKAAESLVAE